MLGGRTPGREASMREQREIIDQYWLRGGEGGDFLKVIEIGHVRH